MCCVMGYVQYCYVTVDAVMAEDVLFVVIVTVKAFMTHRSFPERDNNVYRIVWLKSPPIGIHGPLAVR